MTSWLIKAKECLTLKTSHEVNVDAKGVPTDININVSGLPNLNKLMISVSPSTRNAIIVLLYSVAFFFVSHGIHLLVHSAIGLTKAFHVGFTFVDELLNVTWTNFNQPILLAMFIYVFIIFPLHYRYGPDCKCRVAIHTEFVHMKLCVLICLVNCVFLVSNQAIVFIGTCVLYYVMCKLSFRKQSKLLVPGLISKSG